MQSMTNYESYDELYMYMYMCTFNYFFPANSVRKFMDFTTPLDHYPILPYCHNNFEPSRKTLDHLTVSGLGLIYFLATSESLTFLRPPPPPLSLSLSLSLFLPPPPPLSLSHTHSHTHTLSLYLSSPTYLPLLPRA